MSARKRTARRKPRRTPAVPGPSTGEVSVRMYNVGFGDAFLLTFPADDRPRRVLIDCGSHAAGPPPAGMEAVVAQIIEDVTEAGRPHIDVVIATHRHRDHVLGFASGSWSGVQVGQVWMPWTEDPVDLEARRIRETQGKRGLQLQSALKSAPMAAAARERAQEIVDNSLPNAAAMATLHGGFAGSPRRRYLPEVKGQGNAPTRSFRPRLLPGVTVHVLGPSRDREVIRDMDPPPAQSYLRAAGAAATGGRRTPFAGAWAISPAGEGFRGWLRDMARRNASKPRPVPPLRPTDPGFLNRYVHSLELSEADVRAIDRAGDDDPFAAAVALDKAVNGTSLMLVFEVGRARLLFPGDAQWGTWNAALSDPRTRELLASSTFYKVGHHGSHNATPVHFVEHVLNGPVLAMVSTCATKRFTKIPRLPLLKALALKASGVARSDDLRVRAPFRRVGPHCVEARIEI